MFDAITLDATLFFAAVLVVCAGIGITYLYFMYRSHAPFVRTKPEIMQRMLNHVVNIENATVLDLGSGAGDIVLAAARRGARAVGIEINPFLVWLSRWRIRRAGLAERATILRGDLFILSLPQADAVTIYLMPNPMIQVGRKLAEELPPHTRIISHAFAIPQWKPVFEDEHIRVYDLPSR